MTFLRHLLVMPIRLYQIFISPLLPPSCRYHPSCSAYAIEAVERHGILNGSWLILRRLLRCHPWGGSGYDPVPDIGTNRHQSIPGHDSHRHGGDAHHHPGSICSSHRI
ncbi:MAG TPA: membrane protein insertion efficiency factor YidD [Dongiaceae bacterium]